MKMTLNIFSMGMLVFVAITVLVMSSVALGSDASVSVQVLKYEPSPVAPGQYFDLWLNLENTGFQPADKVTLELIPGYPFSIDSSENATRYFGSISSNDNAIVKYKIRVAIDAIDGWNDINLRYKLGTGDTWITKNLSVLIRTPDAVVSIESASTLPSQMAPGKEANLTIKLKNLANSVLKDVTLKLDLSSLSIYPIGTATEGKIYILQPGETGTIAFNLLAGSSMDSGAYKIPINITYSDFAGTNYIKRDYLTVIVGETPEISASVEKTEILKAGETGKVTFNIINKGVTGVKFLQMTLKNSADYEIVSPYSQIYVGKMDSDDYQTVDFTVFIKSGISSPVKFPINLQYRDANNNVFDENRVIEMKLYNDDEIAKFGLRAAGGFPTWMLVIILIIVAYLIYTRFFKKGKK